jgi:hypothetical protein
MSDRETKDKALGQSADSSSTETLQQVRLSHDAAYVTGGANKFYEPIPEYEGRHRWDPKFEWEPAEEKKLIRKVSAGHFVHTAFHLHGLLRSSTNASALGYASCSSPSN